MSAYVYPGADIISRVPCDHDDKESIVDIYVSAESLKVHDNPWMESRLPNVPGPAGAQHPVPMVGENSAKRNHVRTYSVFLGVLCLLLLAGIIFLAVRMNKDKTLWDTERNQLLAANADLRKTSDQLTANYAELSKEKDCLLKTLSCSNPKKCSDRDLTACS